MDISKRKILITGASRGLGRELAFAFANAGAREVIADARKPEDIEQLKADALADGAPITPVRLDVRFEEDVAAVVALGPVDILVNNAASPSMAALSKLSLQTYATRLRPTIWQSCDWSRHLRRR